ncbi:MAG TPA: hypothetical protein VI431_10620 [Candidatus Acidoferrum sp.]
MMHPEIEDQEIIERYVRNQLAPQERQAFEEHFFDCQECFEKVQATERFVAGIRDAASRGMLEDHRSADYVRVPALWRGWMFPALAASSCAAVALAVFAAWTLFFQMPKLRQQVNQASADANSQRQAIAALEKQIASATQIEPNVPLVMLQATRDAQASVSEAVLPPGAQHLVLWMDVASGRYRTYRLEIYRTDDKPVETLKQLARNSYGALAVGLPAERLQPGEFRIKLFGEEPSPASLLAEYKLKIRRP